MPMLSIGGGSVRKRGDMAHGRLRKSSIKTHPRGGAAGMRWFWTGVVSRVLSVPRREAARGREVMYLGRSSPNASSGTSRDCSCDTALHAGKGLFVAPVPFGTIVPGRNPQPCGLGVTVVTSILTDDRNYLLPFANRIALVPGLSSKHLCGIQRPPCPVRMHYSTHGLGVYVCAEWGKVARAPGGARGILLCIIPFDYIRIRTYASPAIRSCTALT